MASDRCLGAVALLRTDWATHLFPQSHYSGAQLSALMDASQLSLFGVMSGIISMIAFLPYIAGTYMRRTQPQRASWLIWSVLGSIAFLSQIHEGATASLWFVGVQVSGTLAVFLLSVSHGIGSYLRMADYAVLGFATVGVVIWYQTDSSAYALAITITISLLGGAMTVAKAFKDPNSEALSTWVLSLVAAVFALLAVGSYDPLLIAYPLYLLTLYSMFIFAICLGRLRATAE